MENYRDNNLEERFDKLISSLKSKNIDTTNINGTSDYLKNNGYEYLLEGFVGSIEGVMETGNSSADVYNNQILKAYRIPMAIATLEGNNAYKEDEKASIIAAKSYMKSLKDDGHSEILEFIATNIKDIKAQDLKALSDVIASAKEKVAEKIVAEKKKIDMIDRTIRRDIDRKDVISALDNIKKIYPENPGVFEGYKKSFNVHHKLSNLSDGTDKKKMESFVIAIDACASNLCKKDVSAELLSYVEALSHDTKLPSLSKKASGELKIAEKKGKQTKAIYEKYNNKIAYIGKVCDKNNAENYFREGCKEYAASVLEESLKNTDKKIHYNIEKTINKLFKAINENNIGESCKKDDIKNFMMSLGGSSSKKVIDENIKVFVQKVKEPENVDQSNSQNIRLSLSNSSSNCSPNITPFKVGPLRNSQGPSL